MLRKPTVTLVEHTSMTLPTFMLIQSSQPEGCLRMNRYARCSSMLCRSLANRMCRPFQRWCEAARTTGSHTILKLTQPDNHVLTTGKWKDTSKRSKASDNTRPVNDQLFEVATIFPGLSPFTTEAAVPVATHS